MLLCGSEVSLIIRMLKWISSSKGDEPTVKNPPLRLSRKTPSGQTTRKGIVYIAVFFFSRQKTYTKNGPGPKSALGPVGSPCRPPWAYVDAEFYQEFVFDSFRRHRRREVLEKQQIQSQATYKPTAYTPIHSDMIHDQLWPDPRRRNVVFDGLWRHHRW